MTCVAAPGLVCGGSEDAGAGGADRMAQRNSGTVGADALVERLDLPLVQDGRYLGGESLVELDEVDLVGRETDLIQSGPGGADGADAHDLGPQPVTAHERNSSGGVRPRLSASARVVTTHIAVPSIWPEALPAGSTPDPTGCHM
jgi:hypothetical protein